MENSIYKNDNDFDANEVLKFDTILRKEYDTDIIDFMELEDDMLANFSLYSSMAEGSEQLDILNTDVVIGSDEDERRESTVQL